MELYKRRWYVTWFFLSLAILDKFWGRDNWRNWRGTHEDHYSDGTNLCHFMRVILIWAPLVVVLHVAFYGTALATLTILPMRLFGMSGYLSGLLAIAVGLVLIVLALLAMAGISELSDLMKRKLYEARARREAGEEDEPVSPAVERGPSFVEVLKLHIVSAKQQICPIIKFRR